MFRKLLSSLAFSPGMIDQLYTFLRQKRRESVMRYQALLILPVFAIFGFAAVFLLDTTSSPRQDTPVNQVSVTSDISSTINKSIEVARIYPNPEDSPRKITFGDVVSLKIAATNTGKSSLTEDLALDLSPLANYSSIIDGSGASLIDANKPFSLIWPQQVLKPNQEVIRTVLVQVSEGSAYHTPLTTQITFGNTVELEPQTRPQRTLNRLVSSLPVLSKQLQATVIILVAISVVYCYYYTLLLIQELEAAAAEFEHVSTATNHPSGRSNGPDRVHAYRTVLHAIRNGLTPLWRNFSLLVHFAPFEKFNELLVGAVLRARLVLTSLLVATIAQALLYFYASSHQLPISGSEQPLFLIVGALVGGILEIVKPKSSKL